jgi:hypothetical protein
MKFFHSIRWRIQLWHGLLLTFVLAGFGFTAGLLYQGYQFRNLEQEMDVRLSDLGNDRSGEMVSAFRDYPRLFPNQRFRSEFRRKTASDFFAIRTI